jgi:hypothetical protein
MRLAGIIGIGPGLCELPARLKHRSGKGCTSVSLPPLPGAWSCTLCSPLLL